MDKVVPANLFITVCSFCSVLYFGIGVAIGNLVTGYLIELSGATATFGYYTIVSFVMTFVFAMLLWVSLLRQPAAG